MAEPKEDWVDFGWQGVGLRVPQEWNLGKVEGTYKSGYARLDDATMVRAEIEWREEGKGLSLDKLVGRYLDNLEKKANKANLDFSVKRRARVLNDKRFLEGSEYETFVWEADYRAYNLARQCPDCGRIVLLRLLTRLDEKYDPDLEGVFASLQDHPLGNDLFWSVYGLRFCSPVDFSLREHQLKSGHIQLVFEKGREELKIHRLSMAQMLLKQAPIEAWYEHFFKKSLRDFKFEVAAMAVGDLPGVQAVGRPRSRWRQILRPLPLVNPRPRRYIVARAWHSEKTNKICVVEHLYPKKGEGDDLIEGVVDGYFKFQEGAATESRGDAQLAAGPQ
jgi:hypothetical protein